MAHFDSSPVVPLTQENPVIKAPSVGNSPDGNIRFDCMAEKVKHDGVYRIFSNDIFVGTLRRSYVSETRKPWVFIGTDESPYFGEKTPFESFSEAYNGGISEVIAGYDAIRRFPQPVQLAQANAAGLNGQEPPVSVKAPGVSPEPDELNLETNQPHEIVFENGNRRKVYHGFICLNCVYPLCKCGQPLWGTLPPILAQEKPFHKNQFNKTHALKLIERERLFYLRDVGTGGDMGSKHLNRHAQGTRILMELLGYDGNHIDQIIERWETDYKAAREVAAA